MGSRPGTWHGQIALLVAASVLLIALGGSFHHHGVADADHDCSVCLAVHAGGQAVATATPLVLTTPVAGVVEARRETPVRRATPCAVARGPPTVA